MIKDERRGCMIVKMREYEDECVDMSCNRFINIYDM